jgi:hypothetical protein
MSGIPPDVKVGNSANENEMSIVKIIASLACMLAGFFMGLFAWASLCCPDLWFKFVPAFFAIGLITLAIFLFIKRRSPLANSAKWEIAGFFCLLLLFPVLLDFHIRTERHTLQTRARTFLARPIPKLLIPDSQGYVGGYYVDTNAGVANGVFGFSRVLIERYATKGRIRWSAAIQGQFACTGDNCLNGNISEDVLTNEDVRRYSAESHAILADEWRMGYWQWVEDTMEFKSVIPEIEEEDKVARFAQQLDGTWTNGSGTMSISNNGTFSAISLNHGHSNILKGTEVFYSNGFKVTPDGPPIRPSDDEKDFIVIHVDDHHLIYEVDDQTNSMSR